jgi:hypothetical protein
MDGILGIIASFIAFFVVSFGIGELVHLFFRGGSESSPAERDALLLAVDSDTPDTTVTWDIEMIKAWEDLHELIEAKPRRRVLELSGEGYRTYVSTKTPGVISEVTMEPFSPYRQSETTWSRADASISRWPLLQAVLQKAREQEERRQNAR